MFRYSNNKIFYRVHETFVKMIKKKKYWCWLATFFKNSGVRGRS